VRTKTKAGQAVIVLLLAAALVGPPAPAPCPAARTAELFHGFVVDSARIGGGLMVDLWSTEFALARCPSCREGNPLGLTKSERIYLKGATAAAEIAVCHKLRRDGHPVWAKWTGRLILGLQAFAAADNVRLGIRAH
jgi:hypothetical protein